MLSHLNVGTGEDVSIAELAELLAKVTGFSGRIAYDRSRPDGTPRKLLDVSKLNALGWRSTIRLKDGVRQTYEWFLDHVAERGSQ
jgi:nucleoside-diphosphate-sugar epimerase